MWHEYLVNCVTRVLRLVGVEEEGEKYLVKQFSRLHHTASTLHACPSEATDIRIFNKVPLYVYARLRLLAAVFLRACRRLADC